MEHQINLPITGMHCENCASTITRHLKKMEGILVAEVSLATEYAAVTFDASTLSEETIVDKIRDLGFDVVDADEEDEARAEELRKAKTAIYCRHSLHTPPFPNQHGQRYEPDRRVGIRALG